MAEFALLKQIRSQMGLSQKDLSQLLGVKQNTISQYETGIAKPSINVLARLYNLPLPGDLREAVRKRIAADLNAEFPEHPEFHGALIEDIASAEKIVTSFPPPKSPARAEQLTRLAHLVPVLAHMRLEKSVVDIVQRWVEFGDEPSTAPVYRDAADYVEARLNFLAGVVDPDFPENVESLRKSAQTARRLAIALLRQAEKADDEVAGATTKKRRSRSRPTH